MHETAALKALVYDNQSGARELTERTLQLLARWAADAEVASPSRLLDELADVGVKVIRSKPEMPQLFHAVDRLLVDAEALPEAQELASFRSQVQTVIRDHLQGMAARLDRLATQAASLIHNGGVVVTTSRSSTVLATLLKAKAEGTL